MSRRAFDPDHCTACGDFLPCGESWIECPSNWCGPWKDGVCVDCGKPRLLGDPPSVPMADLYSPKNEISDRRYPR